MSQSVLVKCRWRLNCLLVRLGLFGLGLFGHEVALIIPRYTFPTRLESLVACIEARERMSLSIQDDLIERKEIVGGKEKVHVLQCLSLRCVLVNKFSYFDV